MRRAPSVSVRLVAEVGIGFKRFRAQCGRVSAVCNDPYMAAARAIGRYLSEPYPYWRDHKTSDGAGWSGAVARRDDPIEKHRWFLFSERAD